MHTNEACEICLREHMWLLYFSTLCMLFIGGRSQTAGGGVSQTQVYSSTKLKKKKKKNFEFFYTDYNINFFPISLVSVATRNCSPPGYHGDPYVMNQISACFQTLHNKSSLLFMHLHPVVTNFLKWGMQKISEWK